MLLALAHGLLYVFVVPPWQHYDEPGRFEHAWLIANRPGLPEPGDEVPSMRRELLASMVAHDFFVGMEGGNPAIIQGDLSHIGISQLQDEPLYYWLAALPLRGLRYANITLQLYAARLFSVGLYLLSIFLAWKTTSELVPSGHPLRWSVPLFMVLLPAYTDVMTMLGDDVGAVAAFSFFLLRGVLMIRRGMTPWRLFLVIGAAVLCVETKNTVAVAVILVPLVILLAAVRKPLYLWAAVLILILGGLVGVFSWGDAAFWERNTPQSHPTSQLMAQAPWGERALALNGKGYVRQYLPRDTVEAVQDEVVTLGAWAWSSTPTATLSLRLSDGQTSNRLRITVEGVPTFHVLTMTVASPADYISIDLRSLSDPPDGAVYFDGALLTPGEHLGEFPPTLSAPDAQWLRWGDKTLPNYVRNGSMERRWPRLRSWVAPALQRLVGRMPAPAPALASILDWERTRWVYAREGRVFFETFWARFGWAHVGVPTFWYGLAGGISALGIAGGLSGLVRGEYRTWEESLQRALLFLFVAGLTVWGGVWLRVHPFYGTSPFLPGARYAFPSIFPVALFIIGGSLQIFPRRHQSKAVYLILGLTLILDVVSLWSIIGFYYF
jgi:hypothetical protein